MKSPLEGTAFIFLILKNVVKNSLNSLNGRSPGEAHMYYTDPREKL